MAIHKYIKFTGDYSKLLSMGFEFQKLYANNYMQWSKGTGIDWSPETRVWKKGAEVTLDCIHTYEGVFFEKYLEYKTAGEPLPYYHYKGLSGGEGTDVLRIITNRKDRSLSFDYSTYIDQMKRLMDDPESEYNLENKTIGPEDLTALDAFYNLGWVELGTIEIQDR